MLDVKPNAMAASVAATLAATSADAGNIEWVYEKEGRVWLFGGHEEGQDFDITDLTLDHRKLNFGFGREAFPALREPEFGRPGEEDVRVDSSTRVIALVVGGEARAYPLDLMQHHETVNALCEAAWTRVKRKLLLPKRRRSESFVPRRDRARPRSWHHSPCLGRGAVEKFALSSRISGIDPVSPSLPMVTTHPP